MDEATEKKVAPEPLEPGVILREHVYDGIQEYDQKLPNWWLWTLYITIIWFVAYWIGYYHLGWFRSDIERVDARIAVIEEKKAMLATLDDDSLWEMSEDAQMVSAGKVIFQAKCVVCHAEDLSGVKDGIKLPGLPLNDSEWKHGSEPMKVFGIVTNGSPDPLAGMIAWKNELSPSDIAKVVAFILDHHERPAGEGG